MLQEINKLPNAIVACVGGGSNAIGIFSNFINDENVDLYGVEPLGKGTKLGEHAATIAYGKEGIIHGFKSLVLLDEENNPAPVYSIASGLDYPSIGPEHAYLHISNRVKYVSIDDKQCLKAFYELPKTEGIIPALESSHAVAFAMKLAKTMPQDKTILVNLSGRGDKDLEYIAKTYGI
jgi:tryptophan synthase beta chain